MITVAIVRTNLEGRSDRWSAASQIICLICRMPADAENWRFQGQTAKCFRINQMYSSELEESVQRFLESLGKLKRVCLTHLEEKVLSLLEAEIKG